MEESEKKILVCMNVNVCTDPYPGSIQIDGDCGHPVWISPALLGELVPEVETICNVCFLFDVASGERNLDEVQAEPISEEQRREVEEATGLSFGEVRDGAYAHLAEMADAVKEMLPKEDKCPWWKKGLRAVRRGWTKSNRAGKSTSTWNG